MGPIVFIYIAMTQHKAVRRNSISKKKVAADWIINYSNHMPDLCPRLNILRRRTDFSDRKTRASR